MTQRRSRDIAHVIRCREVSSANCRQSFRTEQQRDGRARAGAVMHSGVITGAADNIHYVALDTRLDPHISYFGATPRNGVGIGQRVNLNLI